MIIYRIFFGFCEICLCFLYIYVYGSKACAALHLGHSSPSALFRHAHWYYFKFFCTQENSFPFPFVLKWCVFISLLHPLPFTSLSLGRGRAVHSLLSAVHTTRNITFFPSFCFVSALPESAAVFLCFIKCPYSTETVIGVFKENLPLG